MKIFTLLVLLLAIYNVAAQSGLPSVGSFKVTVRKQDAFVIEWENPEEVSYEAYIVLIEPEGEILEPEKEEDLMRTVTGLSPGREYTLKIQGVTKDGNVGDEVDYKVTTEPNKPNNLNLKPIDEIEVCITIMGKEMKFTATVSGLEIDWAGVDDPEGHTGYEVSLSPSGGVPLSDTDTTDGAIPTKTIYTGLTPGETYNVEVRTVAGPPYNPITSEALSDDSTLPPDVPLSAEVQDIMSTIVEVKTHEPVVGLADGLVFELDPPVFKVSDPRPNRLYSMFDMYSLRELKAGTSYKAKVYATSKGVQGKKFLNLEFTTVPSPPSVRVTDFTTEEVIFYWSHPHGFSGGDDVYYMAEYKVVGTNEVQRSRLDGIDLDKDIEIAIKKLVPGTKYTFQFTTVVNSMQSTTASDIIVQATIPMPPNKGTFKSLGDETYEVTYAAPDKGLCPKVRVFYSPSFIEDEKPQLYDIEETITLTGIPSDKRYTINARCVSNKLESSEYTINVATAVANENGVKFDTPAGLSGPLPCRSIARSMKEHLRMADACCGDHTPYSTSVLECCGNSGTLISKSGKKLCCGNLRYSKIWQKCCVSLNNEYSVIDANQSC